VKLQGYLAWDDAIEELRPGVVVVHEWSELNDYAKQRAEMLAELGYVALAVDMYGKGKVTEDPQVTGR
jgi:dienelactone hydrolase